MKEENRETENILEINNLSIAFEKKEFMSEKETLYAVKNLSLCIKENEFTALVGESGCGKSLTALSILKLLPETASIKSGTIKFNGRDIYSLSSGEFKNITGNEISIIFQDPMSCLNPLKKVGVQIREAAIAHGKTKKEAEEKTLELLHLTGFDDPQNIYNCYPMELSGGMMQRVLIAMALINEPKLLIADEPVTALDVTIQTQIMKILFELNKKLKTSVLLISHSLDVVASICQRVYVMYSGTIIEEGKTEDIMKSPSHPYTKALIGAIPDFRNRGKKLNVIAGTVPALKDREYEKCGFYDRCDFRIEHKLSNRCMKEIPGPYKISEGHFARCCFYKPQEEKTEEDKNGIN